MNPQWPEHTNVAIGPSEGFVKRGELDLVMAKLRRGQATSVQAAVAGMGGIGKTRLALEAAQRLAAERVFYGVWRIEAETDVQIRNGLGALDAKLSDRGQGDPDQALRALADATDPWLILYDNATPGSVQGLLAKGNRVTVLITSRERFPNFAVTELGRMTPAEALELLDEHLEAARGDSRADKMRLVEDLGAWPLALIAAAGFLSREQTVSVDAYLSDAEARREKFKDLALPGFDYDGAENLAAVLEKSFEALSAPAQDLLSVLAFLSPDDPWVEMVAEGCEIEARDDSYNDGPLPGALADAGHDPQVIPRAFDALKRLSLITDEAVEGGVARPRLHRLTAEFWRDRLEREGDLPKWRDAAARLLNAAAPVDFDNPINWDTYRRLMPHARALLTAGADSPAAARLFNQIAGFAVSRGAVADDLAFAEASVAIAERLTPESATLAASLNQLGSMQDQLKRYDDALATLERARVIQASLPEIGPDHPSYAATLNNIAGVHWERKDFAAAAPLLEDALRITRGALGGAHPATGTRLANLGALYSEWATVPDNPDRAAHLALEDRYKPEALAVTEAARGPYHPETAIRLNNEALRLHARGLDGAAAMMNRAAALAVDLLGPDHPSTVRRAQALCDIARSTAPLQTVREQAVAERKAHRGWGAQKLDALCKRYGLDPGDNLGKRLAEAVNDEQARLRAEGKPDALVLWVSEEAASAVHALDLSEDPGPAFDEKLRGVADRLKAAQ